MTVHFRVIQPIALLPDRVAEVGGSLDGLQVIVRRSQASRHAIHIGRSVPDDRSVLSNKRIKGAGGNRVKQWRALRITGVGSNLVEALIDEASVIAEMADEAVALEVQVAI